MLGEGGREERDEKETKKSGDVIVCGFLGLNQSRKT